MRTDYNEKKEPSLTNFHAHKLYKRADFSSWRHWYNSCFIENIRLRNDLQFKIDDFYNKNLKDSFVIGAHIRHPSHIIEQPGLKMPSLEVFKKHIDKQLKIAKKIQSKIIKIFIATDQDSVITFFKKYYPKILITNHDSSRTNESQDSHFNSLVGKSKNKEGFQILHIIASNKNLWSKKMAEEVIIDAYILAKSDVFIHVTSNIATAVSYMNPNCKMIYCD